MLGLACLFSGLFFFWDTATRWHERKQRKTRRILAVNAAFLLMTAGLLQSSQSTTSRVCFVMGCIVILAAHSKVFRRHPALLKTIIPASFGLFLILDLGFALGGSLAKAVGKDPTLTDRTKIWAFLLGMHTNPIIGTGYQSFWLGSRLKYFWDNAGLGPINEAHNGYLEVYLELGLIGVILLVGFLIVSYWVICRRLTSSSSLAVLGLATWLVLVFYNMSEAGFNNGLLYLMLLMSALAIPARARKRVRNFAAFDNAHAVNPVPDTPLSVTGIRPPDGRSAELKRRLASVFYKLHSSNHVRPLRKGMQPCRFAANKRSLKENWSESLVWMRKDLISSTTRNRRWKLSESLAQARTSSRSLRSCQTRRLNTATQRNGTT